MLHAALVLQGAQDGLKDVRDGVGWTVAIMEDTGRMVLTASGDMVAVHTVQPGERTIRLPKPCRVTDAVTGKVVAESAESFKVELAAPETKVFLLDEPAVEAE